MDEVQKRKSIKLYFEKYPILGIVLIILGLVTIAIYVGIAFIAGGIFLWYKWIKNKPTDQQYDEWVKEDLSKLHQIALQKLGVDESTLVRDVVYITGINFWDVPSGLIKYKKGKDSKLRYNPIVVDVINFGKDQILIYECIIDMLTGNRLNESTEEFFYKDIVSVSTKNIEAKKFKLGNTEYKMDKAQAFVLTTSGGTSITVVLKDEALMKTIGDISTNNADQAIQSIRTMLRDKKA